MELLSSFESLIISFTKAISRFVSLIMFFEKCISVSFGVLSIETTSAEAKIAARGVFNSWLTFAENSLRNVSRWCFSVTSRIITTAPFTLSSTQTGLQNTSNQALLYSIPSEICSPKSEDFI